jgi:tRNA(Ile)-lysidine synthetase-like protein
MQLPPVQTPPVSWSPPPGELGRRFVQAWQALEAPSTWRRVLVAVSGGPDSLALLHLLHDTRHAHRLDILVGHADHGIHPDSAAVAQRVVHAATALGWPVVVGRLALGPGASETTARTARHGWLERTRRGEGAEAIVLAHHRDDQIETVLLRALEGSGPAGLAGMRPRQGRLLRPLLEFGRPELGEYLAARGVVAWSDPANEDPAHRRSWIRARVLPLLQEGAPDVGERLLRLAEQAAGNRRGWEAALEVIPGLDLRPESGRISVAALSLAGYDSDLAVALLQAVARRAGFVLGPRRAERVLKLLKAGRSGRVLELGADVRAEVAFGRLSFYRSTAEPSQLVIASEAGAARWGAWRVRWSREASPSPDRRDGWVAWFIGQEAVLRGPAPGDRLLPLGGTGRRLVGRCLQDARVERSRRGGWPLVEVDGALQWIAGVCRGAGALPAAGVDALRIEVSNG